VDPRERMTETEKRMANVCESRIRAGEVQKWWFEDLVFRVGADRTTYKPDFVLLLTTGELEVIEVKGAQKWEDSLVKFKAAAREYTFARWRMLEWNEGQWRTMYDYAPQTAGVIDG
jgi:hypothetical protein